MKVTSHIFHFPIVCAAIVVGAWSGVLLCDWLDPIPEEESLRVEKAHERVCESKMTSMITARVDAKKRQAAERVFSEVGLTTSAAVNLFICAVAMHGGIPFPICIQQKGIPESPVAHARHTRGNGLTLGQFASKVKLPVGC